MNAFAEVSWWMMPLAASPWPVQLGVNVIMALLCYTLVWQFIKRATKSIELNFKEDIWPILKKDPRAVAIWRLGVFALAIIIAFVAFGGFK